MNYCPCYRCVTFLRNFIKWGRKATGSKACPKIFFPLGLAIFWAQNKKLKKNFGATCIALQRAAALNFVAEKVPAIRTITPLKSWWLLTSFLDCIVDEPRQNKNKEKNGACRFLSLAMKIELHYQRFLFNYEQYINHEASRISALPILF